MYTYSFQGRNRDLSDILATVIKDEPRFISNFMPTAVARDKKHCWTEDLLVAKSVEAVSADGGVLTLKAQEADKISVGSLLVKEGDSALFRVASIGEGTATLELASFNGSSTTTDNLTDNRLRFKIVSNGEVETDKKNAGSDFNCIQNFKKPLIVSGVALNVSLYSSVDNTVNRQTAFTLSELARDLNRVALFGRRVEETDTVKGEVGGLYFMATGEGSLSIDAESSKLTADLINDACQMVMAEGGEPTQILCSPGQARVLSLVFKDRLQILRSDERRGAYVAVIVNEINGRGMTIMADPDIPDTDCWVLDTAGFGLSYLSDKGVSDRDDPLAGFDGIRRMIEGNLTLEFRNAKQRCCRIKNLMPSPLAIYS